MREGKKITSLTSYIDNNSDGLHVSRSLKYRAEAERLRDYSGGAMEKSIGVVIGRRFKKQSMS